MDQLVQLLVKQYGLSQSEAQAYAKVMGEVNNNPIQKAIQDQQEAEARYKFLVGQQELVKRRDTIMQQSSKKANQERVAERDTILNKPIDHNARAAGRQALDLMSDKMAKGNFGSEIQMKPDNSPRDRRDELRALADYKSQGFFPGEIQMPAMDARTGYPAMSNVEKLRGYGVKGLPAPFSVPSMATKKVPEDY